MEAEALPLERGVLEARTDLSELRDTRRRLHSAHELSRWSPVAWYHPWGEEAEAEAQPPAVGPPHAAPPSVAEALGTAMPRAKSYQVVSQLEAGVSDGRQPHHPRHQQKQQQQRWQQTKRRYDGLQSSAEAVALLRAESGRSMWTMETKARAHGDQRRTRGERLRALILETLVNLTSGMIAFLLSSTLAVSCASVIVGHGTPLAPYIAHFIDMNFVGTAMLSLVLTWKSSAPWTLGSIDVFVVPVMATMASRITSKLDGDMDRVVPTTVVMVSMVSCILGAVFFLMGALRVTSIANYMPYPVIAGFLSGIGAELVRNGMHMAAEKALSMAFFTWHQQALLWPAIVFAALVRIGKHRHWPVAISFPCLLMLSLVGFHSLARVMYGQSKQDLEDGGWLFPWPSDVVRATPMWHPWLKIDFNMVSWRVLSHECFEYLVSLILLGALKYSVATTSLSTLFGREISPDHEMRVIGLANIVSGLVGGCGGCHYLSAMTIMKQFDAHEHMPALVSVILFVLLWMQGIRLLQLVPKFVFGGLLLNVGQHFLEAYFIAPFHFLKRLEQGIVVLITASFLVIGMLEAVGLGVIISLIDLAFRIHNVGCIHHETTGQFSRSSVDRSYEQAGYLDQHGAAIFVLRLQGYLFFGTSVSILERIETRVHHHHHGHGGGHRHGHGTSSRSGSGTVVLPRLAFVVIDFGLVSSVDATALLNLRKATQLAERFGFELYFCGLKPAMERALRRNDADTTSSASASSSSQEIVPARVHYLTGDVDRALELCENRLLPEDLRRELMPDTDDWERMSQLALWKQFIGFLHDDMFNDHGVDAFGVATDEHAQGGATTTATTATTSMTSRLLALSAYLEKQVLPRGALLARDGVLTDTYFICSGAIDILADSEFSSPDTLLPGVSHQQSRESIAPTTTGTRQRPQTESEDQDQESSDGTQSPTTVTSSNRVEVEDAWLPFTTARARLRKIGPGSIITPDTLHGVSASFYQYVATSDCVLLRLSPEALRAVERQAPHTAVAVLTAINHQVATRFLYANKRVTQLASLLYK